MQIIVKSIDNEPEWPVGTEVCKDSSPTTWAPEIMFLFLLTKCSNS